MKTLRVGRKILYHIQNPFKSVVGRDVNQILGRNITEVESWSVSHQWNTDGSTYTRVEDWLFCTDVREGTDSNIIFRYGHDRRTQVQLITRSRHWRVSRRISIFTNEKLSGVCILTNTSVPNHCYYMYHEITLT